MRHRSRPQLLLDAILGAVAHGLQAYAAIGALLAGLAAPGRGRPGHQRPRLRPVMNLHTSDAIRAETEYRREQLSRSWPKKRSAHKEPKEKMLMKQPTSDLSSKDDSAIRRIVADIEDAFNDNDPDALVRHIATDAIIVNPLGTVMRGPAEVEASVRPLLVGGAL